MNPRKWPYLLVGGIMGLIAVFFIELLTLGEAIEASNNLKPLNLIFEILFYTNPFILQILGIILGVLSGWIVYRIRFRKIIKHQERI
ncbi:hypothetical protein HYT00_02725 [Candidatus Giovannonibacteria bacterium]|nr:hypothetical protein [Candidatus Giovannonibacteria bacterium]